MYIYFLVHEVMITWMRVSKLGRHSPGGDRVITKSKDVTTRHSMLSGCAFTMTS